MCFRIVLALVLFLPCLSFAIDQNELPFGYYALIRDGDPHCYADTVRDMLGANFVNSGQGSANYHRGFASAGIEALSSLLWPSQTRAYINSSYSVWQAEKDEFEIKFDRQYGFGSRGSGADTIYWVIPPIGGHQEDIALDDLWYRQPRRELQGWGDIVINYTPKIMLWVDTTTANSGDTVGYFKVYSDTAWWNYPGRHGRLLNSYPIVAGSFSGQNPRELEFGTYQMHESSSVITYQVTTTNVCSLKVDYIKVHNTKGFDLIENNAYDIAINTWVTQSWCDPDSGVYAWDMRDEPFPDMYLPYRYVDSLIRDTTYYAFGDSVYGISNFCWPCCNGKALDFLEIAKPVKWATDPYPYLGKCKRETKYAGVFTSQDSSGLQYALRTLFVNLADTTKKISDSYNIEWWLVPQLFLGRGSWCDDAEWRWPTASELACETYIGMCYRPDGIIYFKHGSSWSYDPAEGRYAGNAGLYDTTSAQGLKIDLFNELKNNINPYIKAIDSTYLLLSWDRAFCIAPDSAVASGSWISSISTWSPPDTANPDTGWYHVGQYTEGSAKYLMLVNRACSQGENDPTAAPSVTATVRFDPSALGLGNYVYIIDLADSLRLAGADTGWVGIPDTTYSAALNGAIPFTTVLGPGEGRLYKIVGTTEKVLAGNINTNYTYQGVIGLTADASIPSNETMKIKGPAIIYPDSSTKLIVQGTLNATGYSADSVIFKPFESTSPGYWEGIYVDEAATADLELCSLNYSERGIELRPGAEAAVSKSKISNSSESGIYNYKGYLDLANSTIAYNGAYGLYGYLAADSVYNTRFIDNEVYGVKIYGTTLSNDSTFILYDTLSCVPFPAQYGIYVENNDYVRIHGSKVSSYDQGGIYLKNSDAFIDSCDFSSNINYGLYAANNALPKIRRSVFNSLDTGVKAGTGAIPDLGVSPDSGKCSFDPNLNYYVHFTNSLFMGPDTLWAEYNWWGTTVPRTSKFHTDYAERIIDWEPILTSAPKLQLEPQVPLLYSLNQNYPNPFNPTTAISFALDKPGYTVVSIYNLLGQIVTILKSEHMNAGEYQIIWDGRNDSGVSVSSGVYLYTLASGDRFDSKKMLLLR